MSLDERDLIDAAFNGDVETVKLCLEAGVPVDGRSLNDFTALQWACFRGIVTEEQPEIVRLLIAAGADVNHVQFVSPKEGADPEECDSVLNVACAAGNPDIVKQLVAAGVDVNRKTGGTYPLIIAAGGNCAEAVRVLLEQGADKSVKDSYGRTALCIAGQLGFDESARILEE